MSVLWFVDVLCEDGVSTSIEIEASDLREAIETAEEEAKDWMREGDWGDGGASVSGKWTLEDEDGAVVDEGFVEVQIEPNHEALIGSACNTGYGRIAGCGIDPDDHDWTSDGEGGCSENPGVWSTGGTSMVFASHCRTCGLQRRESYTGSQRNPGEHDTVSYTMPDSWCEECQSETCECDEHD